MDGGNDVPMHDATDVFELQQENSVLNVTYHVDEVAKVVRGMGEKDVEARIFAIAEQLDINTDEAKRLWVHFAAHPTVIASLEGGSTVGSGPRPLPDPEPPADVDSDEELSFNPTSEVERIAVEVQQREADARRAAAESSNREDPGALLTKEDGSTIDSWTALARHVNVESNHLIKLVKNNTAVMVPWEHVKVNCFRKRDANGKMVPIMHGEPFKSIVRRMDVMQGGGARKLEAHKASDRPPEDWTTTDWSAWFLWHVYDKVAATHDGFLYAQCWSVEKKQQIIYFILKLLISNSASSRAPKGNRSTASSKAGSKAKTGGKADGKTSDKASRSSGHAAGNKGNKPQPADGLPSSHLQGSNGALEIFAVVDAGNDDEASDDVDSDFEAPDNNEPPPPLLNREELDGLVPDRVDPIAQLRARSDVDYPAAQFEYRTASGYRFYQLLTFLLQGDEPDVYGRLAKMGKWIGEQKAKHPKESSMRLMGSYLDQKAGTVNASSMKRFGTSNLESAENVLNILEASAEVDKEDLTNTAGGGAAPSRLPSTLLDRGGNKVLDSALALAKLTENERYEPKGYKKAFRLLHMINARNPRLPGMKESLGFKWWQVLGIAQFFLMWLKHELLGYLCCDSVGLGKTWIASGFTIAVYNHYALVRRRKPEVRKMRAVLFCVPPHLVNQWAKELGKISELFHVIMYHGNIKVKTDMRNAIRRDHLLTNDEKLFKEPDESRITIVLSSWDTMAARHCLAAKDWMVENEGADPDKWQYDDISDDWPHNLAGCFEFAIADESHIAKNTSSSFNAMLRALRLPFLGMLTATPIYQNVGDLVGTVKLIEKPGVAELFKKGNPKISMLPGEDPWTHLREDPAENSHAEELKKARKEVQLCSPAVSWWINGLNPEDYQGHVTELADVKGSRIASIYERILMSRGYRSKLAIPGGGELTVAHALPTLLINTHRVTLSADWWEVYTEACYYPRKHITTSPGSTNDTVQASVGLIETGDSQVCLNAASRRLLDLFTLCPLLMFVEPLADPGWMYDYQNPKKPEGAPDNWVALPEDVSHPYHRLLKMIDSRARDRRLLYEILRLAYKGAAECKAQHDLHIKQHEAKLKEYNAAFSAWDAQQKEINDGTFLGKDKLPKPTAPGELKWNDGSWPRNPPHKAWRHAMHLVHKPPRMKEDEHGNPNDDFQLITMFMDPSPKLRDYIKAVTDIVLVQRKKVVVWTAGPIEQDIVTALTRCCGIVTESMSSDLDPGARAMLQMSFLKPVPPHSAQNIGDRLECPMVLVCNYYVNQTGMNLHENCGEVIMLEPATSDAIDTQSIGRVYRLNNPFPYVRVLRIVAAGTNDDVVIQKALDHSLPAIRAMMDTGKLGQGVTSLDGFYLSPDGTLYYKSANDAFPVVPHDWAAQGYKSVPNDMVISRLAQSKYGTSTGAEAVSESALKEYTATPKSKRVGRKTNNGPASSTAR